MNYAQKYLADQFDEDFPCSLSTSSCTSFEGE